jgi:hypothetical protein
MPATLTVVALLFGTVGCGSSTSTPSANPPGPSSTTSSPTPTTTPSATATATRPVVHPSTPTKAPTEAPTPATPVPTGGTDRRVYVLGDSVLLGTVQTLPAALKGWRVTMDCVGSRRLTQAIQELRAKRARIGAVLVIQMGNNYIPGEDGSFGSQIDQAMRVVSGVTRVIWVTVAEKWPNRVPLNKAIRAAAARWSTIRVADWAPVIATHPGYAYDMLHLTPTGRLAMARLIATAVGPAPR